MRDTSIRTYRAKLDFTVTPEPTPRSRTTKGRQHLFVVQKHAARSLHWGSQRSAPASGDRPPAKRLLQ